MAEEQVRKIVKAVHEADAPMTVETLQKQTKLSAAKVTNALTHLEQAGALEISPTGEATPVAEDRI